MIWRIVFVIVLFKKLIIVVILIRKVFFGDFLCISFVINIDKNGMIISLNGGKKNELIMIEIILICLFYLELLYFFKKYLFVIKLVMKMKRVKMIWII